MKYLGPTRFSRLNEALAVLWLLLDVCFVLSLASYHPADPSWNTATGAARPLNLIGPFGALFSDSFYQVFGLGAWLLPALTVLLIWKWVRSEEITAPLAKVVGAVMMVSGICALFALGPDWRPFAGAIPAGGMLGLVLADLLIGQLNTTGAVLATGGVLILSLYVISTFSIGKIAEWFTPILRWWRLQTAKWRQWQVERRQRTEEKLILRREAAREKELAKAAQKQTKFRVSGAEAPSPEPVTEVIAAPQATSRRPAAVSGPEVEFEPPVRVYEEPAPVRRKPAPDAEIAPWEESAVDDIPEPTPIEPVRKQTSRPIASRQRAEFHLPPTDLLNEPPVRNSFDNQELKDIAVAIKSKFEEFNVRGTVTQINPGPVVTTYEYKPEAGVKLSRITTLSEDLCLGLQAESILIERIPGKPTVGIEVPNSKREVISLREILESSEFQEATSCLTIPLGKDINGRIKVATIETMPHLLIAGSTGAGKSVMLNSMIMSVLYKSTPNEVRLIMVDPKRVELGIYEGIPHLLTPVITDPRKATNALRNAVLEMERRLKLLASFGVRNIDQFNKKVKQRAEAGQPMAAEGTGEEIQPLPYILIIIDELADLMMLERNNVEEAVTRLAQMARAVGMHLVLATQRPSVDVITGLIKANFPARMSFRVATRVDSRTVLDSMGAEHLLGKGDMLFLPPGSSRLVRVHGAFVTEAETNDVVEFWKDQARPEYDDSFLAAPPSEDGEGGEDGEEVDGSEDPMYHDAVRVVMELGKASTSTLQRRLRLGYGRAARILDMMQRDGIIGPPDGSRPREVLKRPDWLDEVEETTR